MSPRLPTGRPLYVAPCASAASSSTYRPGQRSRGSSTRISDQRFINSDEEMMGTRVSPELKELSGSDVGMWGALVGTRLQRVSDQAPVERLRAWRTVFLSDSIDAVHVDRMPVQVDGHDELGLLRYCCLDRLKRRGGNCQTNFGDTVEKSC
eukprot:1553810-Rhodomonas_salina.3